MPDDSADQAGRFVEAVTVTGRLPDAIATATRLMPLALEPQFLPALLGRFAGPRLQQIRTRMAQQALTLALHRLPPQELPPAGLALAFMLTDLNVRDFAARYSGLLDAAFFDRAETLGAALREHEDRLALPLDRLDDLLREVALLWAANMLPGPLTGLLEADPADYLAALVAQARHPLPAEVVRLGAMYEYFARSGDELLCRAALAAWAVHHATALAAAYPAAEDFILADLLRYEGAAQARRWEREAKARPSARQLFHAAACWLLWGRETPAPQDDPAFAVAAAALDAALNSPASAGQFYREALLAVRRIAPPAGRIAPLLGLAGLALDAGDTAAGAAYLGVAERFGAKRNRSSAAHYAFVRARLLLRQGARREARREARRGLKRAGERGDQPSQPDEKIAALRLAAAGAERRGDVNGALELLFELLLLLDTLARDLDFIDAHAEYHRLLDRLRGGEYKAETLFLRGRLLMKLGRPGLALAPLEDAIAPARDAGKPDLLRCILSALASCHHSLSQPGAAERYLQQLHDLGAPALPSAADLLPATGSLAAEFRRMEVERTPISAPLHDLYALQAALRAQPGAALLYLEARSGYTLALLVSADAADALALAPTLADVAGWLLDLRAEAPRAEGAYRDYAGAERFFNGESFAARLDHVLDRLGALLWQPLHARLASRRIHSLTILPDAHYAALPLHAAPLGGRRVLDFYNIGYAPAATALLAAHERATAGARAGWAALVGSALATPPVLAAGPLAALADTFGPGRVSAGGDDVPALLAAAGGAALLHVHRHGRAEPDEIAPSRSYDLVGGGKPAILVVLAVCESGEVSPRFGATLAGQPAALLASGVAAVLAAPWRLSEPATSLLLRRFYERMGAGLAAGEALRAAQIWLRELPRGEVARQLRELARAARYSAAVAPAEANAAGRLLEALAEGVEIEGRALERLGDEFAAGEERGLDELWKLRSGEYPQSSELAAALLRDQAEAPARIGKLLKNPYASPYYWGGLQAVGAAAVARLGAGRKVEAGSLDEQA